MHFRFRPDRTYRPEFDALPPVGLRISPQAAVYKKMPRPSDLEEWKPRDLPVRTTWPTHRTAVPPPTPTPYVLSNRDTRAAPPNFNPAPHFVHNRDNSQEMIQ